MIKWKKLKLPFFSNSNPYFLKKNRGNIALGGYMKCVYCNNNFYIKRSILDLFKIEKEYICNRCYKNYPINFKLERIQLDIYECTLISLFDKKYYIDMNYYIKEYSKVFRTFFKKENYKLLFFDEISLDDNSLEELDCMSKLFESNLIIIVFNVK
jgi:hypothetical protein